MAYETVTLTGAYQTWDGQPASGVVEIIPNSRLLVDAEGDVILSGRAKVTLDEAGSFSVTLPATDDATVEPALDRQYTVVAKLRHAHLPAVTGVELAGGGTYDVADLTSAVEAEAAVGGWLTETEYDTLVARVVDLELNGGGGGGEGGVTDHGALTGLADDDHAQYLNNARGDARYYTKAQVDTSLSGKAATAHTHAQSDVTGLDAALAGKVGTTDPRLSDARTPTAHTHDDRYYTETEVDAALTGKAAASDLTAHTGNTSNPHGVTKAQVGLSNVDNTADTAKPVSTAQQAALDAKAAKSANLSDLASASAARTNLGLGTAATVNTGTASGNVPLLSTGGVLPIARLATGTPDGTKFVRDDGTLATPAGGGGATAVMPPATSAGSGILTGYAPWASSSTMTPNIGRVHFWAFVIERSVKLVRHTISVTTAQASTTVRIGIYASNSSDQPSGNPLYDASIDTSTTGFKATTPNITLSPGIYYTALLVPSGTGTSPAFTAAAVSAPVMSDTATGRTFRDSFPDSSYTALPTGWSRAPSDGWATSPNPPWHCFSFEETA